MRPHTTRLNARSTRKRATPAIFALVLTAGCGSTPTSVAPEDGGHVQSPDDDAAVAPMTDDAGSSFSGMDAAVPPFDRDGGVNADANDGGPPPPVDAEAGTPRAPIWVAAWADAPDSAGGTSGSNQTFREIVKPTVGSRGKVRLHFSNFFGTAPITLGAVHVGLQTAGAGVSGDVAVTFSGASAVTIPAGGYSTSDDVALAFDYGAVLAVTEYVTGSWTALTQHVQGGGIVTSYATAANAGDQTSDVAGANFSTSMYETYLADRADVYGDYAETVATFGSSTTDGLHSGVDAHMTYPEQLAAALHAAGRDDVAIANVGIAGTTVLGSGPTAGINRFARDVLGLPNVTKIIDYLGANDLRLDCVQASALIAGKENLLAQAHQANLAIYVATTAPSTFCGAQNPGGFGTRFPEGSGEEAQRFLVVAWESAAAQPNPDAGGAEVADAIIDFNGAITDPSNKSYMLPDLDSGDDIHPNATGYGKMVQAIPLSLF